MITAVMFSSAPSSVGKVAPPPRVLFAYGVFLSLAAGVWHFVAAGEFSAILTMAVIFQCAGFVMLALQVVSSGSAAGISARSVALEAAALCCRLSSTMWLDGYLPNDASGDWLYQAVDVCSVLVVMWLLREVLVTRRSSYQSEEDSAPYVVTVVVVSVVLATLLHGDMNDFIPFDALWMIGLFVGVVAVLPQLWFITRAGGKVSSCTSHSIALMAMARALSGLFMWHAREDITCEPWVEGINHAIWAILSAHLLHLLLIADFFFVYLRTMITSGMQSHLDLDPTIYNV